MTLVRRRDWDLLAAIPAIVGTAMIAVYVAPIVQQRGQVASWFIAGHRRVGWLGGPAVRVDGVREGDQRALRSAFPDPHHVAGVRLSHSTEAGFQRRTHDEDP